MISLEDVEHLSKLARIGMSEDEKKELQKDLERILEYVSTIKEVSESAPSEISSHRNQMRADDGAYEAGAWTDKILGLSPDRKGDYIRVKKVLKEGR